MIAVVTRDGDVHGVHIVELLRRQNREVAVLDYASFPSQMAISLQIVNGVPQGRIRLQDGTVVESEAVTSVLNRRQAKPIPSPGISDRAAHAYVVQEAQALLDTLPQIFPTFWVSEPDSIRLAKRKAYQLITAQRIGLETPSSLISNDPSAVDGFASYHKSDFALKAVNSPGVTVECGGVQKALALYTKRVDRETLMEMRDALSNCPTIIQAYVPKAFELRITVVGQQLFACAIYSQNSERTREDWRRYDLKNTPHEPYRLPPAVARQCHQLIAVLKLQYGCIDMVVTPDGRYVFLEINPGGQWLWIEQLTGLPISQALVDLLVDPSMACDGGSGPGPTSDHTCS